MIKELKMSNIESIASSLTMEHIVFDKVSFTRKGFKQKDDSEISLSFHVSISQTDNPDVNRVTLQVLADAQDEYDAEIQITGYCSISSDCPNKQYLLENNAVAILFPYVRSELTLITAQPETSPIVLPAVNINSMIRQSERQE